MIHIKCQLHGCASLCSVDNKDNGLHLAAWQGEMETVKFLVEELNMNPADKGFMGQNSFLKACNGGNTEIVKFLAEKDPELIKSFDNDKDNGLHLAALQGDKDMVDFCIEELDMDPAAENSSGENSYSRPGSAELTQLSSFFENRGRESSPPNACTPEEIVVKNLIYLSSVFAIFIC